MIDGVDALNNILVIGMTNRKDMIDEAILRPGRFEVSIYSMEGAHRNFITRLERKIRYF